MAIRVSGIVGRAFIRVIHAVMRPVQVVRVPTPVSRVVPHRAGRSHANMPRASMTALKSHAAMSGSALKARLNMLYAISSRPVFHRDTSGFARDES